VSAPPVSAFKPINQLALLVVLELLGYLQRHYAPALIARYKLTHSPAAVAALADDALLEEIGRKRGAMMAGGRVNIQKTAELVLTDLRAGAIGRVTLETPPEFEAWLAVGEAQEAERKARKAERDRERKNKGRGRG
jgi:ribosome biogenesis GTPase A